MFPLFVSSRDENNFNKFEDDTISKTKLDNVDIYGMSTKKRFKSK